MIYGELVAHPSLSNCAYNASIPRRIFHSSPHLVLVVLPEEVKGKSRVPLVNVYLEKWVANLSQNSHGLFGYQTKLTNTAYPEQSPNLFSLTTRNPDDSPQVARVRFNKSQINHPNEEHNPLGQIVYDECALYIVHPPVRPLFV